MGLRGRQDAPINLTIDRFFTDPENPAVGDFVSVGFELTNAPAASDEYGRFWMLVESPQLDQSVLHHCTTIDPGESGEFGPAGEGMFFDIEVDIPTEEEMAASETTEGTDEPEPDLDAIDESIDLDGDVGGGGGGDVDGGDVDGGDVGTDGIGEIDIGIDDIDIPSNINPVAVGAPAGPGRAGGVRTHQDDLGGSFRMPSEEVTLHGSVGPIHDFNCSEAPSNTSADDSATITVSPSFEGVAGGVSLAGPCRASTTRLRRNESLTVEQDVQNSEPAPVEATVQWVFPNGAVDETVTIPANSTETVSVRLNTLDTQAIALEPLPADMMPRTELTGATFA